MVPCPVERNPCFGRKSHFSQKSSSNSGKTHVKKFHIGVKEANCSWDVKKKSVVKSDGVSDGHVGVFEGLCGPERRPTAAMKHHRHGLSQILNKQIYSLILRLSFCVDCVWHRECGHLSSQFTNFMVLQLRASFRALQITIC